MLTRVLLHLHEPLIPVNLSPHSLPRCQRSVCDMKDEPIPLLHVQHTRSAKLSRIGILTSPFREKCRTVKLCLKMFSVFLTRGHPGFEFLQMTVLIKQLLSFPVFCHTLCHKTLHPFRCLETKQINTRLQHALRQGKQRDIPGLLRLVLL